jgi:hypothetical protein
MVCGTFGVMHAWFGWGNLTENRGVDGRINITMDIKEVGWEGVNWIWLRLRTSGGLLFNAVTKIWVP